MEAELVAAYAARFVHNADHYAVQQRDGSYWHVPEPLTLDLVLAHLLGRVTLGTYLLDRASCCAFAVFDADREDGLQRLGALQSVLWRGGIPSLLEASRRGGHLWLHFVEPTPAHMVRAWLLPYAEAYGTELYPKQDWLDEGGSGSLIRLPLGVHRKSRGWYPFVTMAEDGWGMPVGETVETCCAWACAAVYRVAVPERMAIEAGAVHGEGMAKGEPGLVMAGIRAWCEEQDCRAVIGRYVALNERGVGCCPFKAHHYRGDRRPSFQAFADHWYCYTWGRAGNLFDFVCLFFELTPQEAWRQLAAGWQP